MVLRLAARTVRAAFAAESAGVCKAEPLWFRVIRDLARIDALQTWIAARDLEGRDDVGLFHEAEGQDGPPSAMA
jgi:hypothetical protein